MNIQQVARLNLTELLNHKDQQDLEQIIVNQLKDVLNSSENRLGKEEFINEMQLVQKYANYSYQNYIKYTKARFSKTKYNYAFLANKWFNIMRIHLDELLNMQSEGIIVLPDGTIYKTNLLTFEKEAMGHNRRFTRVINDYKNWSILANNMGNELANINRFFDADQDLSMVNFGWRGEVLAKMAYAQVSNFSAANIAKYASTADNMRATIFEDIYDATTGENIRVKTFGAEAGGLQAQAEFCFEIITINKDNLNINTFLNAIKQELIRTVQQTRPAGWTKYLDKT